MMCANVPFEFGHGRFVHGAWRSCTLLGFVESCALRLRQNLDWRQAGGTRFGHLL